MKRKVLFVVHQLNHGGVQKALLSALDAIDYSENEVTLYIRKNRIQLLPEINKNVYRVIVNNDKTHYYRKPYAVFLLLCKKISDIFHIDRISEKIQKKLVWFINESQMKYEKNHYFNHQDTYDVAVSYIQGYTAKFVAQYIRAKKKVMFFHGSTDETHELHEEIMPYFNAIVGVNENVQKILQGLYPHVAKKMTYIENYVDAELVREKSRAFIVDKPKGKVVLCSCGRFTPVKGFDLAIKAAKILKENGQDFLWYFVGDGPERAKMEDMIERYGLREHIFITGLQDNPYPYIGACDIYVQPSYEEAHPLTIIEAQILNKPVVTTDTVGGNALVKSGINGIVTEINSTKLAFGINQLLDNHKKYSEIENEINVIEYSKDWEKYQFKWHCLLEV